jgi:hypothetical protein
LYQLNQRVLIVACLLKTDVVYFFPFFLKKQYPNDVTDRCNGENHKNLDIVVQQDNAKNNKIDSRENNTQRGLGQKCFNTALVANALHEVSRHFGIKITDRQAHQFYH